jgi:hypothetical protein
MFSEERIRQFTSFTPRERLMLTEALDEARGAISLDAAKELLSKQEGNVIPFENERLRLIAFAFKVTTAAAVHRGWFASLTAFLLFSLKFVGILFVAIITGGFLNLGQLIRSASLEFKHDNRIAHAIGRDAIAELLQDIRSPLLFLRSFATQAAHGQDVKDLRTIEELLADAYKKTGPLLALGDPGESIASLGSLKLYFDHNTWQAGVLYLMSISQMIIIQVGISPGTLWELAVAKRRLQPERVMISLADPLAPSRVDVKYYLLFKKYLEEIIGWTLPNDLGFPVKGLFIRFGADWQPMFYGPWGNLVPELNGQKKDMLTEA